MLVSRQFQGNADHLHNLESYNQTEESNVFDHRTMKLFINFFCDFWLVRNFICMDYFIFLFCFVFQTWLHLLSRIKAYFICFYFVYQSKCQAKLQIRSHIRFLACPGCFCLCCLAYIKWKRTPIRWLCMN